MSLRHAAELNNGGLVEGSVRKGWTLTDGGAEWFRRVRTDLLVALQSETSPRPSPLRSENRRLIAEKHRIQHTEAWQLWAKDTPVGSWQAAEVFRVDRHTEPDTRTLKIRRQIDLLGDDPDVGTFVLDMADIVRNAVSG
jgi:hypothetical protein